MHHVRTNTSIANSHLAMGVPVLKTVYLDGAMARANAGLYEVAQGGYGDGIYEVAECLAEGDPQIEFRVTKLAKWTSIGFCRNLYSLQCLT